MTTIIDTAFRGVMLACGLAAVFLAAGAPWPGNVVIGLAGAWCAWCAWRGRP